MRRSNTYRWIASLTTAWALLLATPGAAKEPVSYPLICNGPMDFVWSDDHNPNWPRASDYKLGHFSFWFKKAPVAGSVRWSR